MALVQRDSLLQKGESAHLIHEQVSLCLAHKNVHTQSK